MTSWVSYGLSHYLPTAHVPTPQVFKSSEQEDGEIIGKGEIYNQGRVNSRDGM